MKIRILGSGCERCDNLYRNAIEAVEKVEGSGSGTTVEKVADPEVFYQYKVAVTPALLIDEEVISTGKLLTPEQIAEELTKHKAGG